MSDDLEIKDKIINDALKNINFDGWTKETILTGFVSNKINVDYFSDFSQLKFVKVIEFKKEED